MNVQYGRSGTTPYRIVQDGLMPSKWILEAYVDKTDTWEFQARASQELLLVLGAHLNIVWVETDKLVENAYLVADEYEGVPYGHLLAKDGKTLELDIEFKNAKTAIGFAELAERTMRAKVEFRSYTDNPDNTVHGIRYLYSPVIVTLSLPIWE